MGSVVNGTAPPLFGHVTPWSSQLGIVFGLYASVAVVCSLVYFIGRYRKSRQYQQRQAGEATGLLQAVDGPEGVAKMRQNGLREGNMFRYLWRLMRMSQSDLEEACGADAAHYLRFEKYVMYCLCVMVVMGLAVLLPIYIGGDGIAVTEDNRFDLTTASNLGVGDPKLWATVASVYLNSALCYFLVIWMFRKQSYSSKPKQLRVKDFTLHLSGLPKSLNDEALLAAFFLQLVKVKPHAVVISENLEHLRSVYSAAKVAVMNLDHARAFNELHEPRRLLHYHFLCFGATVDSERFWEAEKERLERQLRQRGDEFQGTGHAFVTFDHVTCASRALALLKTPFLLPLPLRHQFAPLNLAHWRVTMAPHSRDVNYKHLSYGLLNRVLRVIIINLFLALAMIFFTTPISLIAVLSEITHANILSAISDTLADVFSFFGDANTVYGFVSSTLMVCFTFSIPRLMIYFSGLEKHHTKSHTEMSVVRKIYAYLFLCIIVMPAIFMTSVDALLKIAVSKNGGWQILADLGGVFPRAIFFVNYLLAIGLVSNFFELLNLPGSVVGWFRMRAALTAYERRRALKTMRSKFQLGYEYSYQNVLLSMTLLFSSVVPVLLPFALFAFFTKHCVDRNNLVHVYSNPHTNTKIVRVVLTQVIIGCGFYQMVMFCFFLFGKEDETQAIAVGLLLVASVVVGMYVRFWTVSPRRSIVYDFEEEDVPLSDAMRQETYRDPLLYHDLVKDLNCRGLVKEPSSAEGPAWYSMDEDDQPVALDNLQNTSK